MTDQHKCELCGEPMPPGEEMFNYHGYSGPCPKPPLTKSEPTSAIEKCIELAEKQSKAMAIPAEAELSRLRSESRELAAMRAGGVWLKRCVEKPKEPGQYAISYQKCGDFASQLVGVFQAQQYFGDGWIVVGPFPDTRPHEGRDDDNV